MSMLQSWQTLAMSSLSPTRVTFTKPMSVAREAASMVWESTPQAATIFLQIFFALSSANSSLKLVIISLFLIFKY